MYETIDDQKVFRKVFVVEPSHDFSALIDLCDEIVFLTTGYETLDQLPKAILNALVVGEFTPSMDAVLPVGKVTACLATGMVLRSITREPIFVGSYSKRNGYQFSTQGASDEKISRSQNGNS